MHGARFDLGGSAGKGLRSPGKPSLWLLLPPLRAGELC